MHRGHSRERTMASDQIGDRPALLSRSRHSTRMGLAAVLVWVWLAVGLPEAVAQELAGLARLHEGRSMRATSAHRSGSDGKYDPAAELDPNSNWDNQNVPPGETRLLMEAK